MKPLNPSRRPVLSSRVLFLLILGSLTALATNRSSAQKLVTLHSFAGGSSDGSEPRAGLTADRYGNLYGTTLGGGVNSGGTVFKVTLKGTETVLYNVPGHGYRSGPVAGLVIDRCGNLYGTNGGGGVPNYYGGVFKVTPRGTTTIVYSFTNQNDGAQPTVSLMDASGNIYGTATGGGKDGYGTIFKLTPNGALTVLYSFKGGTDGDEPNAAIIADRYGNLYGTTYEGGQNNLGTVFKVTLLGRETVLHSFAGGNDGSNPSAGLVADSDGNFYGTTQTGGKSSDGTVFKITPEGKEAIIHSFTGGNDGVGPYASLITGRHGNLYGTTVAGGKDGYGTVFKVAPEGSETVLYSFTNGFDGSNPVGSLLADNGGHLFGTTVGMDALGPGTVFKLSLPGAFIGIPGEPRCVEQSLSELALEYGGLAGAARELGYVSIDAMSDAASSYCHL